MFLLITGFCLLISIFVGSIPATMFWLSLFAVAGFVFEYRSGYFAGK